jgi:hypothetical protein
MATEIVHRKQVKLKAGLSRAELRQSRPVGPSFTLSSAGKAMNIVFLTMAWKSGDCRFLPSCDDGELAYIMTGATRAYDLARMKRRLNTVYPARPLAKGVRIGWDRVVIPSK